MKANDYQMAALRTANLFEAHRSLNREEKK